MTRILIADDDVQIQTYLRDAMLSLGYDADVVGTGRAVFLLASINYDLIILDVNMPEWDGISGLELARGFGNQSPVLFITGDGGGDIPDGSPVLLKPFRLQELLKVTQEIIQNHNQ